MDIAAWLRELGLERYEEAFRENDIDVGLLSDLTETDLEKLGVASLGHRKILLRAMEALRRPPAALADGGTAIADEALPAPPPPASRTEAERRQLTVLFCDLVGSTELSAKLDPEDLGQVIRDYHGACTEVVERWGGHVAKYMGDGVLAYFGWPQAHEDEAERAVRAGLDLVAVVAGLATPDETSLASRVGIATGRVVVGELIGAGTAQEEAVVGETPNLAARLQALAEPGDVVISQASRRLVGGLFELVELGAHDLKGFGAPVPAWRVAGQSRAESRFEALHGEHLTPLVGREHELGLLLDRWRRAKDAEGQVVLLSGEAGIGKSRLLRALRERLVAEPYTALPHDGSPFHTNSALHPVIGLLERAAGFARTDPPETRLDKLEALLARGTDDLAMAVPLVAALLGIDSGDRHPDLGLDPQRQKQRTLEVLVEQVAGLAGEQPVLALFEDAHWFDPTTLELLDLLVERVRSLPVLVVITHRPDFTPPWSGQVHVTQMPLARLGQRDGAAIASRITAGKALPTEVLEQILGRTEGVPLFVEELTKTVVESGLLTDAGDHYELSGPLPPLAIPRTLHDSLMARLDRLLSVKEIAQIGACIGREFSHELLQMVAGAPEDKLQQGLGQLIDNQLIFRRGVPPDAIYIFKHALVQDAAYESLLRARRRVLHASILGALEVAHRESLGEVVELLAYHSQRGELWEKAITYLWQAGKKAYSRSAGRESRTYYEQALCILEALPESRSTLEQAFEISLELRPVLNQLGQPRQMLERLRAAEGLAERLNDRRRRGTVCALVTIAHSQLGELDEGLEFARRALKIAVELGDLRLRILATTYLELAHYYRGEYEPVVELAKGNLEALPVDWVYEYLGASAPSSVYDRSWLIQSLAQIGRFVDAMSYEAEILQIAEQTNHPFTIGQAHRATVTLHLLRGDWARAYSLNESWIAGVRKGNVIIQLPWAVSSSAWILAELGESSVALDRLREGEQLLERQTARELVATNGWDYHLLGRACLSLGRLDEARRLAIQAVEYSSHQPGYAAHGLHLLGDIATRSDPFDAECGEAQYRKAQTLAEMQGMRPLVAHCHLGLGKIYRRTGKQQAAEESFRIAMAMYREMDMGFWLKRAEVKIATPA